MKKIRLIIFLIIIALVLVFAVPMAADIFNIPVSKTREEVTVTIEPGASSLGIGATLENSGVVRSSLAFFLRAKLSDKGKNMADGTYKLSPSMTITEVLEELSKPKPVRKTMQITFPEGYTVEQMALEVEAKGLVSREAFLEALNKDYDYDFLSSIPRGQYNYAIQGFLFPDTYEFYEDSSAEEIVDRLLARFGEVYKELGGAPEEAFEVITKASMVEKEAKLDSERPIVAGVIENRTEIGMAYQIDACVLYAATDGLYNREDSGFIAQNIRDLDSPYNTYMYAGLPAGPICNPGETSIQAVLEPQEHRYLYYHTDTRKNDGSHIFTETFNEHVGTLQ